jgi:hypothetical protein
VQRRAFKNDVESDLYRERTLFSTWVSAKRSRNDIVTNWRDRREQSIQQMVLNVKKKQRCSDLHML